MASFSEKPQLRIGEDSETERRATWLELFYDLVFVVAVSQLAHYLHTHVSLSVVQDLARESSDYPLGRS